MVLDFILFLSFFLFSLHTSRFLPLLRSFTSAFMYLSLCLYFTFTFLSICMHLHFCFFMYAHLKFTFYYIIYRLVHRVSTFFLFIVSINSYIYFSLSSRFACLSLCKNVPTYYRCLFLPFYVRISYVFLTAFPSTRKKYLSRSKSKKKKLMC